MNVLTDGFDEVRKEDTVAEVRLEVGDSPLAATALQVVIRPVCVDLQQTNKNYY